MKLGEWEAASRTRIDSGAAVHRQLSSRAEHLCVERVKQRIHVVAIRFITASIYRETHACIAREE